MNRRPTIHSRPAGVAALVAVLAAVAVGAAPIAGAETTSPHPVSVRQSLRHEPLHWGDSATGEGSKIIFRYRPDGTNTNPGRLVGGARVDSVTRPAPLGRATSLRLDGRTGAFTADQPIATRSTVGETIEVWFRSGTAQRGTLFSDLTGHGGMELAYDHGRLQAKFVTTSAGGRVVQHAIATTRPTSALSGWHVAALTVDVTRGVTPRSRIYLDNKQVTTTRCGKDAHISDGSCRLAGPDGISLSTSATPPSVGARPGSRGPVAGSPFDGWINAVQVANWSVDHDILSTPAPRDGSTYFGRPGFFDQPPGVSESDGTSAAKWSDRTWDLARREAWSDHGHPGSQTPQQTDAINAGMATVSARVGIGLLDDHYVPQGVAVSADGRTMSTIYYYADDTGANPAGGLCGAKACPDVITRTDLSTMTMIGIYLLSDESGEPFGRQGSSYHANGLVDAGGYLYAALATSRNADSHIVEGAVFRFRPSQAKLTAPANSGVASPPVYTLIADASYPVASSGGSMSYAPTTRTLYLMGDYQPESMATGTNPGGDRRTDGDIVGYRLDAAGAIAHPSVRSADEYYTLPRTDLQAYNQGLAWTGTEGGRQCFIVSRSAQYAHLGHSSPEQPSDWSLETILDWTGQLTSWCGSTSAGDSDFTVRAVLPSGLENVALGPDGTLWTLTENGARYYQRRTNHQEWYPYLSPYVLGIPITRLGR